MHGPAALEQRDAGAARRIDRSVVHRNADQMDQGQGQTDRQTRKTGWGPPVGRALDDEHEHRGQDEFAHHHRRHGVAARGVCAVAIRGKAARRGAEAGFAGGDGIEHGGRCNRADHLREDVRDHLADAKPPAGTQTDRHRRIEVPARHVPDGIHHGEHREAEGERHAEKADAKMRISRIEHCGTATAKHQPERPEELSRQTLVHWSPPSAEQVENSSCAPALGRRRRGYRADASTALMCPGRRRYDASRHRPFEHSRTLRGPRPLPGRPA